MESTGKPTSSEARTTLDDIDRVQRAVRDTPWPVWLYPANAALVAALGLTPLLDDPARSIAAVAVAALVVAVNVITGYRMGTPWALPTDRVFLISVAVAALLLAVALSMSDTARLTITLAVTAATAYSVGAVFHYRSTRR